MLDISALGELLMDFTPAGKSGKSNRLYECNPGGAPANVLAALAKLGKKTAFIGKVGDDSFGNLLKDTLDKAGISTEGLCFSKEMNTTITFVNLNEQGDRSFLFYRKPGADMMLTEEEINYDIIKNSTIFHFGSVSMTDEPSRTATLKAAEFAKKQNKIISYDPNLRLPLWCSREEAKKQIIVGLEYPDILKISEEEMEFITGTTDFEKGTSLLSERYNIKIIFVTLGSEGCFYRAGNITNRIPGFRVETVDTTGAGDAFLGAALYKIIEMDKRLDALTQEDLDKITIFANGAGALVTTKKGAISVMPSLDEVEKIIYRK